MTGRSASSETPNHSNHDVDSVYSDFDLINDVMQEFMLVPDDSDSDDADDMDWFNVYRADSSEDDDGDEHDAPQRCDRRARRVAAHRQLIAFTPFMCPSVLSTP